MSPIDVRHDLRGRFGRARDQGGRETCLAFATSDAHAATIGHPWQELCCEYLFYHAKQRDGTSAHLGTTFPAIRAALEHDGQPVESEWPYLAALPTDLKKWKPPAKIKALFHRRSKPNGTPFDEVWNSVEADRPVIVGMTLSDAFRLPDKDGVIDVDEPTDPVVRHAVVAVATGKRGKKKLVFVRNSWGLTWGLSGYGWVSERYMSPRILGAMTLH